MASYVILGASGKIGGAAAHELRRSGLPVRAILRDPAKSAPLSQAGCEVCIADVFETKSLETAFEGAAGVLAICPMDPRAPDAPWDHRTKVDSLALSLSRGCPEFVVAVSDYGAHHASGAGIALSFHYFEEALASLSIPSTVLRSAEHMQNWTRFIQSAATAGVLPYFYQPRERPLPLVSAPDVGIIAAGVLAGSLVPAERSRVYHVEGPRRYSIDDVIQTISALVGHPVQGRELARHAWLPALLQAGLSESYAKLLIEMYEAHNSGRIDIESPSSGVLKGTTTLCAAFRSFWPA